MRVRGGFTLMEMVITLVVASILILGTFRAMHALYLHSAKARAVTELSLQSQITLDQIVARLYQRVPNTTIGYKPSDGSCTSIYETQSEYQVLEWLLFAEANLTAGSYDGFVDMANSSRPTLATKHLSPTKMGDASGYHLIFAGSFDSGDEVAIACEGAYGWHGNDHNYSYPIERFATDQIRLKGPLPSPMAIFEKYYLTHEANAIARLEDVDTSATCIQELNATIGGKLTTHSLLLFSGYQPAKDETFCADPVGTQRGSVTLLAQEVVGFEAGVYNGTIRLKIDMNRTIRGGGVVHIGKQKAVF